jgi:hypothetical protein
VTFSTVGGNSVLSLFLRLEIIKMNKFDALKQFQSWPREWQELCGEYWAECEESFTVPSPTAKVAVKVAVQHPSRNGMRYTRDELTEVDSHMVEGRGPSEVASIMNRKYPRQRTLDAWEKMANRIKKAGLLEMLDKAVDWEAK